MARIPQITLGDVLEGVKRYQPLVALVAVIVLIAVVLPGRGGDSETVAAEAGSGVNELAGEPVEPGETTEVSADDVDTAPGGVGDAGPTGEAFSGVSDESATGGTAESGADSPAADSDSDSPVVDPDIDCDPNTGRVAVPSVYAPPCPPSFNGDNGGTTYRLPANNKPAVTGDAVKIAIYRGETNPATEAIFRAAGISDEEEDIRAAYAGYIDLFEKHFQTWGRELDFFFIDGGASDDDVAARADAKEVIDKGAFISIEGPTDTNVYMRELAQAGVICICTYSQPVDTYVNNAPYVWGQDGLLASTQLYIHRSDYAGGRLWGRPAVHAGDESMKPPVGPEQRVFGFIYFDTSEGTYTAGADFFEKRMKEKYGANLKERIAVTGAHTDPASAQQEAPTVAKKLDEAGVTTVIFAGDPLYPIFLTQESTKRSYFPEWMITGSVYSDTTLFARTYDQQQWRNAFGVSQLSARVAEEQTESYTIYEWHNGEPPPADATHGLRYINTWLLATGIHMAGPNLNPQTFRDGLFAYPPSGGGITTQHISYGTGVWPWTDYLTFDDATEIWWDANATGEDEAGNFGTGMYRYVDGGKRYMPGQWPTSKPKAFVEQGSVMIYDELPEEDRPPRYQHKPHD